ncbi:ABC-type amino acid transport system, periplasmic amino acid-binding protein [Desulforapulum autotrophicum HRM2]|uniref:ABC-type amino acid transport system, periplasmic amino acid-binding protein n=1 Tax=Desulforapulum autotrophicum (strain ATCC 43914 / DSM 3382 / VKM B-1955 / HRM2) TaxID=177437 RepID=C0QCC5_DESAH|nr:transporter substrate-binding domain-containing protein [Desulforapulum autotrophicum]ACN17142.1 ABC-type amino acid transport system, periplasmic amino acid-binding protein [Desulforapulum autotrophicum HRM2]
MSLSTKPATFFTTAVVALVLACATIIPQVYAAPNGESTVEQVMKNGVLRVGMSTFVPWAMKDKTGKLMGFEIDVATRLAKDMGVKVQFIPTKWSGIIPALLTGKFDIIIGGMGILPSRNLKVNFSIPYDYTGMSMAASTTLAKDFSGLEAFNQKDVVLSARLGSTGVAAIKKYLPNASIRMFDDEAQAFQEAINGRVHGVVSSAPTPAFQAIKHPTKLFLPLKENFTREPIGFAVKKGDFDTINFLNNWITYVTSEGWFKERKSFWFETRDWEDRLN